MLTNKTNHRTTPQKLFLALAATLLTASVVTAQVPNPTQNTPVVVVSGGGQPIAVFHVEVVARTMKAINYNHREGSTHIDFRGTVLDPDARGDASVDSKTGATKVDAHFSHLQPAQSFGPEFVTYVLWAITPEGRASNLGEVHADGSNSSIQAATDLQAFGLMVTAEPYFAVTQPSDAVILENQIRPDTVGTIEQVDAKYELIKRGVYTRNMSAALASKMRFDRAIPLDLQEARNAVAIATNMGAMSYAADTMQKANDDLQNAEGYFGAKHDKKAMETTARRATQMAEDARIITIRKMEAQEQAATVARADDATAKATEADAARRDADAARHRAEEATAAAEAASAQAQKDRAAAETAKLEAIDQQKALAAQTAEAKAAADQANNMRDKAVKDREALREQLRQQLSLVLETRDSARGLIVNLSDVLFDTGQYTLKPGAKEKLAKVSGIIVSHPGLLIAVEGHTDSVGSDDYNQTLSEHRAGAVRDYLVGQGVDMNTITAKGFGKTQPVATNDTADGRQRNRRVELVVSGDPIATQLREQSAR